MKKRVITFFVLSLILTSCAITCPRDSMINLSKGETLIKRMCKIDKSGYFVFHQVMDSSTIKRYIYSYCIDKKKQRLYLGRLIEASVFSLQDQRDLSVLKSEISNSYTSKEYMWHDISFIVKYKEHFPVDFFEKTNDEKIECLSNISTEPLFAK